MEQRDEELILNEHIKLLLANRLVFQTKKEFADYAGYKSLESNNSIQGKWIFSEKTVLLNRMVNDFLDEGTGYDGFDFFFTQYKVVSNFYETQIQGKASLDTLKSALKMAYSLFWSHKKTGDKKIDNILDQLYDYDLETRKRPYVDFDMLLLMLVGGMLPIRERGPRVDPDYKEEWGRLKQYLHKCDEFIQGFENNPLLEELEKDIDENRIPLNRLSFLYIISRFHLYLEDRSHPHDIDKGLGYLDIDGIWQNYRTVSQEGENENKLVLEDKNVFYRIRYTGQGYDFMELVISPSLIKRTTYYFALIEGAESAFIVHPKGGYEELKGEPIGDNHIIWYDLLDMNDSLRPTKIRLVPYMGGKGFSLFLDTLIKVNDEQAGKVIDRIDSPEAKIEDLYAEYSCRYPTPYGIYAITRTHIYIEIPYKEGYYYKVPKEIDERLDEISVNNVAGALYVPKDDEWWIGFESQGLYLSPKECEEFGVEIVDHIE